MSTRSSIFIEQSPGVFYGVYRHHDGYPSGAGRDILEAEESGPEAVEAHMSKLLERYRADYLNYSEQDILDLWKNSDHEYGYLRRLDGTWEVYSMSWGDYSPEMTIRDILMNRTVIRLPGTLEEIVEADE